MQPYYRLMKSILFVLFLSFGMISCEKEDPVSTSPTTRQTDDSTTDPTDPHEIGPILLFVRTMNKRCLCICPGRTISLLFSIRTLPI